ncbi:MAG: hypothetical protein ACOC0K_00770 [bacterium]
MLKERMVMYTCPMCTKSRFDWDFNESEEICDKCFEERMRLLKQAYRKVKRRAMAA